MNHVLMYTDLKSPIQNTRQGPRGMRERWVVAGGTITATKSVTSVQLWVLLKTDVGGLRRVSDPCLTM